MMLEKISPSQFDIRDYKFAQSGIGIKRTVDLREWDSSIEDQGDLGSCVGNAIANAYELMVKRRSPDKFVELSRLFIYYNARELEETTKEDSGVTYLRNALKAIKLCGICSEELWPYIIENFDNMPSEEAYSDAIKRRIKKYESLTSINDMLEALNMEHPIVIGLNVFDGFVSLNKENNILDAPKFNEISLGTHAVTIVGYSLSERQFLIKNSFGKLWGDNGYAWVTFDYVSRHVFERWIFTI